MAQRLKCLPGMWETWVQSLGQEDPLKKEMAMHSSTLAWRIPWGEEPGRLQSTGHKELDTTEQLYLLSRLLGFPGGSEVKASACNAIPVLGRSPGKGNATHSSILAWRIPWTEEPDRLQSMGHKIVQHD